MKDYTHSGALTLTALFDGVASEDRTPLTMELKPADPFLRQRRRCTNLAQPVVVVSEIDNSS